MKGKKEDKGRKEKEKEEKGSVQKLQLFVESFKKNGSLLFPSFPPFFPQKTSKLLNFFSFFVTSNHEFSFPFEKEREREKGGGGSGRKGKERKETEGKGRVRENEGQKKGKKGGKTTNKKQTQKGKKRR